MDQMIGDWAMVHGNGQSICGLTLTNTEATADNFQVFLKPRCDPLVTTFAPTAWRLERGELLLMSASGELWRFQAIEGKTWNHPVVRGDIVYLRNAQEMACYRIAKGA